MTIRRSLPVLIVLLAVLLVAVAAVAAAAPTPRSTLDPIRPACIRSNYFDTPSTIYAYAGLHYLQEPGDVNFYLDGVCYIGEVPIIVQTRLTRDQAIRVRDAIDDYLTATLPPLEEP